jgi:hypothetical protein
MPVAGNATAHGVCRLRYARCERQDLLWKCKHAHDENAVRLESPTYNEPRTASSF